ncbi:MAG: cardiolipin synthase ClsB [Burkholderiaceae bacterium]|jgi:cardiolipin synthase|nr:cardiolipin synthase ClsB [Burkholderiaceae bacterium]
MSARPPQSRPAARRFELSLRPVVHAGNRVRLLVNGEQYFPQLLAAIEAARRSIHIETYIFADDNIGKRVVFALAAAASRGVQVHLIIDGYGGGEHARRLVHELGAQGAEVRIYRPERWWRLERRLLRRLHRKIAVIDDAIAFVGGINIIDDHNHPGGERGRLGPRFDFAVACEGPIVAAIALAAKRLWWTLSFVDPTERAGPLPQLAGQPRTPYFADGVRASLLLRDNLRHRRTIERAYLDAIAGARHDILIACAYFLPGRRFRAALLDATRRGVRVRLLLQGRVEYSLQHHAQRALYHQLFAAGIEIYEYVPSYLHAKVALIDGFWSTVGSSNIDPYSLLLAREANVVVYDAGFGAELQAVLERAIERDAYLLRAEDYARRSWLEQLRDWFAYRVVRLATVVLARARDY